MIFSHLIFLDPSRDLFSSQYIMTNSSTTEPDRYLVNEYPDIAKLLSTVGKRIFPSKGILEQAQAAKDSTINATIGMSYTSSGDISHLQSIHKLLNLEPNEVYPYGSSFGQTELRKLWQQKLAKETKLNPNEISLPVATNGLSQGISLVATMFLDSGDEVIVADPYWGNYKLILEGLHGVKLKLFPIFKNHGFNIDGLMQKVRESNRDKIVILLNSPNNPTGYHITVEEANELSIALKEFSRNTSKSVLLILDEAYKNFTYEKDVVHGSLLQYFTDLGDNFLVAEVDGPTKELFVWGLRVGFVTFYHQSVSPKLYSILEAKLSSCVRGSISMISTLSQSLIMRALQSDETEIQLNEEFSMLKERYLEISKILSNKKYAKYFEVLPFNSGYFLCLRLIPELDIDQIREVLLEEFGVGVITIKPNLVRIAYSSVLREQIKPLIQYIYKSCDSVFKLSKPKQS